uniref:Uncharacterized protein n=1 Tax=Ignisphaera aggregans TaxID=334771 RepID=A0A7J3Z9F6_9CREN
MRTLAVVEANFEDLAQFTVFLMIFIIEISGLTIESIKCAQSSRACSALSIHSTKDCKKLSRFILRIGVSSKYLLLLSIALLYSAIMQGLGLLTLLGTPIYV